jgi:AraC-like DNA-binding protein
MTPGKWLMKKRLDYSANLLLSGDLSVSQVAYESGFEDLSHFSRAFKEKMGMNPTEFRKAKV